MVSRVQCDRKTGVCTTIQATSSDGLSNSGGRSGAAPIRRLRCGSLMRFLFKYRSAASLASPCRNVWAQKRPQKLTDMLS